MQLFPIISFCILLPLLGALFIFCFIRKDSESCSQNAKHTALWTSICTFLLSLVLLITFDPTSAEFQMVEQIAWLSEYNIQYKVGIDGISLFFVLLTTFLMPICILASWQSITTYVKEFMIAFLLLEAVVIGVFVALDLVVFYLFFEASLIPMFLIIGIWGSENRVYAAFKFFLYTLAGSVLLLIAFIYMYLVVGSADIPLMMAQIPELAIQVQKWLWLALFVSFAVKVPMWPVHTWLPDAHVQAPTAGSVILAGVLIKIGAYGFLRFSLPMLPEASAYFAPFIFALSIVAIIYTSLVALMQKDMKKLIAYSSIAHMGFVTIGIFTFNQQGLEGAIFQMLSHGLVSAALFLVVGMIYDRLHTKEIAKMGGLVEVMPLFAFTFMIFTMAAVALPTTSGFVGEMLILIGIAQVDKLTTIFAATGVILGACYMLWLYKRVAFGLIHNNDVEQLQDLNKRELLYIFPMIILVILFGIYPNLLLDYMHPSIERLMAQISASVPQAVAVK